MGDLGPCNPSLFVGIGERRRGKNKAEPLQEASQHPGEVARVKGRASLEGMGEGRPTGQ